MYQSFTSVKHLFVVLMGVLAMSGLLVWGLSKLRKK